MRILNVTAQKPLGTGSGVYLTELVRVLAAKGHELAVTAGIYEEDEVLLPEGVRLYPVFFNSEALPFPICGMSDEMPYPSTRYCDMTEEMVSRFRTAFMRVLKKAVREFRPDLILCHHLYLLTAFVREAFPDIRVCGFSHNTDLRQLLHHDLMNAYIIGQIGKLDRIFALQEAQREEIMRLFRLPSERVELVGIGYNSDLFYPGGKTRAKNGPTKILYAGKIAEKKGVISLMRSLDFLHVDPNAESMPEFLLAGGAGNEAEYREISRLAENAPYPVRFLGRLDQRQMAEAYRLADIFVLPSFYEGLPLTVIEALASGLKVVVSDLPGVRAYFEESVPDAQIFYVTLPAMERADEPVRGELPAFEKRIAAALEEAMAAPRGKAADVSRLTWKRIAEKVIQ